MGANTELGCNRAACKRSTRHVCEDVPDALSLAVRGHPALYLERGRGSPKHEGGRELGHPLVLQVHVCKALLRQHTGPGHRRALWLPQKRSLALHHSAHGGEHSAEEI